MNYLQLLLSVLVIIGQMTLFDFNAESDLRNWSIVDDVVMGGRSNGNMEIDANGHGVFSGTVSLENNGGFSSVRFYCNQTNVVNYNRAAIRIKGDGKSYQFRIKSDSYDRHSYIYTFDTSGEWETIEIPFSKMTPGFRGRNLNMPNYPGEKLSEIAFLIGNKRNESFKLLIDKIEVM